MQRAPSSAERAKPAPLRRQGDDGSDVPLAVAIVSAGGESPGVISPVTQEQAWQPRSSGIPGAALAGERCLLASPRAFPSLAVQSSYSSCVRQELVLILGVLVSYHIFLVPEVWLTQMAALQSKGYRYGLYGLYM